MVDLRGTESAKDSVSYGLGHQLSLVPTQLECGENENGTTEMHKFSYSVKDVEISVAFPSTVHHISSGVDFISRLAGTQVSNSLSLKSGLVLVLHFTVFQPMT
jgi:hypothetical protein